MITILDAFDIVRERWDDAVAEEVLDIEDEDEG